MELNGMALQRRDGNGDQHYKLTEIEPGADRFPMFLARPENSWEVPKAFAKLMAWAPVETCGRPLICDMIMYRNDTIADAEPLVFGQ